MQKNLRQALISKVDQLIAVLQFFTDDQRAFPRFALVEEFQYLKVQHLFTRKVALFRQIILRYGVDVRVRIVIVQISVKL